LNQEKKIIDNFNDNNKIRINTIKKMTIKKMAIKEED